MREPHERSHEEAAENEGDDELEHDASFPRRPGYANPLGLAAQDLGALLDVLVVRENAFVVQFVKLL